MNVAALKASIAQKVLAFADRTALVMEAGAIEAAPKGASAPGLRNQIHGQATLEGDVVRVRLVCTSPYGKYVEEGTGPAVGHKKYMPPPDVLRQWAQRKLGISDQEELDKAVSAIRWKIYMKGTEPKPFLHPAWAKGRKGWKRGVQGAVLQAIKEMPRG